MLRPALFATIITIGMPIVGSAAELSNSEIRQLLIQQSIASYPGNCPCPYNLDRAGRRCGARSAYTKPGGKSPLCFPEDVTDEMVKRYRNGS